MTIRQTVAASVITTTLAVSAIASTLTRTTATVTPVPMSSATVAKNTAAITGRPTATSTPPATVPSGSSAAATTAAAPKALPPLDLSDMQLWNWNGKWMASEWGNGMSPLPWKYDHVTQPTNGDTFFKLDALGAPELQALNGTPAYARGLWEADVTLPQLKQGMVVAPLWLYDPASRDEVDFEFAGRNGLDVTLHANVNGTMQQQSVRMFASQDMSGQRHRFGIKVDETAAFVEMYLDGRRIQRWDRSAMAFFISHPMKPLIEMWAADPNNSGFVSWVGAWQGLAANEKVQMTVHGYGYTAIP